MANGKPPRDYTGLFLALMWLVILTVVAGTVYYEWTKFMFYYHGCAIR